MESAVIVGSAGESELVATEAAGSGCLTGSGVGMTEHIIYVGKRGGGKSEHARKLLGMTHEEYEKHGKIIKELIEREHQHRENMEYLAAVSYFYMIEQMREARFSCSDDGGEV